MPVLQLTEFERADKINEFAWASDFQPYGFFSLRSEPAQKFFELTAQDVGEGLRLRHIAKYVTFLESLDPTGLEQQGISEPYLLVLSGGLKKLDSYNADARYDGIEAIILDVPSHLVLVS